MDVLGDEIDHVLRHGNAVVLGVALEDGAADIHVRRADLDDEAAGEAGFQTLLHVLDVFRRGIAGEDDVLLIFKEDIEGIEKFKGGGVPAAEELYIVQQQDIHGAVFLAEIFLGLALDGEDQLIEKGLAGHEDRLFLRRTGREKILDRVEQMGLPQSGGAVEEERIEGPVVVAGGHLIGHGQRRLVGHPVAVAEYEIIEGVVVFDLLRPFLRLRFRGLREQAHFRAG